MNNTITTTQSRITSLTLNGFRLICILWVTLVSSYTSAHHFKGLPHFNYFENYPQVPQDEFLGQAGEYEFSLVIYDFQGIQKHDAKQPGDVRMYVAIYNLRQNKAYKGPLTMNVLDGDKVVATTRFNKSEEESLYALQAVLPDTGRYQLNIKLDNPNTLNAIIPFKLSSQKIHWGGWVSGVMLIIVGVVAYGSRKARVAVDRKENALAEKSRHISIQVAR